MANATYGTRRVVTGAHYGTRDWIVQRVTAALMALFTLIVVLKVLMASEMSYANWARIFAPQWMRMLTFAVVVSIAWHAWVGMREVYMDYVKPAGWRLALQAITVVWLVSCTGWALQVLWRI
jgi:succinate dehydrogenase / fumarate reductase membrane anchor subunit